MSKFPAKLSIKTVTYVNDVPLDSLSDETIYGMIMERENMIKHYQTMENQPERLKVSLTNIQADIEKLKALVDART